MKQPKLIEASVAVVLVSCAVLAAGSWAVIVVTERLSPPSPAASSNQKILENAELYCNCVKK